MSRACAASVFSILAFVATLGAAATTLASGGSDWSPLTSPTAERFSAVTFSSGWKGWAVGDNGAIACTTDGTTWSLQTSNTGATLRGVDCVNDAYAWACGGDGSLGVIQTTNDGGTTWSAQASGTTEILRDIDFGDAGTWGYGWAVGDNGTILHTTDAGDHWVSQSLSTTASLNGVAALDADHAWACGDGGLLVSTGDAGEHWSASPAHTSAALLDISFGGGVGVAVGEGGVVVRSGNGGSTWKLLSTHTSTDMLVAVDVYDRSTYFTCGAAGFSGGELYVSHTAGAGWYRAVSGGAMLYDVQAPFATVPGPTGWAVGDGGALLQTTDGGGQDTTAPAMAGTRTASVTLGHTVVLRFRGDDPDDTAVQVQIRIRTTGGKLVKTLRPGWRPANRAQTAGFCCTLPRGTYRYSVYGSDDCGNRQAHVAWARLVVK